MKTNAQKTIIISGAIILALIVILIILIIVLGNRNEKQKINYSMENKTTNTTASSKPTETTNTTKNETTKPRTEIEGNIEHYQISENEEIPVPPTFEYVEGDIKTGAVIQDENKNQFVWIPVNEENTYDRRFFKNNGEGTEEEHLEELNLSDIVDYNKEYDKSVEKYGGFYVARFEAGKEDNNDRPVSKANTLPWTEVLWEKAKQLSTQMYDENDYFQTDLINSYAWDTICNWMELAEIDVDDSTSYGNYQDSRDGLNRIVETGSNNRWKVNNIYDMAGNVWEYTTEQYGDHEKYHMGRGGGFWNYGSLYPISTRATSEDSADLNIGFRVVMYLK